MKNKSIGSIVRSARERKEITREQLAKKLKITTSYLSHIERDAPVRLSERVISALKTNLDAKITQYMVDGHNYYTSLWRRDWERKNKARRKK